MKNLSYNRRSPLFWLQYAIACLTLGALDRAERYFEDAYSLAPADYDTFQIDNHYARLLLEKAQDASDRNESLMLVDRAKKIVLLQMASADNRFYPYRVALGLFNVYQRFLADWTADQKDYFERIFQEIYRRCTDAREELGRNRYVQECLNRSALVLDLKK